MFLTSAAGAGWADGAPLAGPVRAPRVNAVVSARAAAAGLEGNTLANSFMTIRFVLLIWLVHPAHFPHTEVRETA
jgi:hypothetical protein